MSALFYHPSLVPLGLAETTLHDGGADHYALNGTHIGHTSFVANGKTIHADISGSTIGISHPRGANIVDHFDNAGNQLARSKTTKATDGTIRYITHTQATHTQGVITSHSRFDYQGNLIYNSGPPPAPIGRRIFTWGLIGAFGFAVLKTCAPSGHSQPFVEANPESPRSTARASAHASTPVSPR